MTAPDDRVDNGELKRLVVAFATEMYYAVRGVREGQDITDGFESLLSAIIPTGPVAEWSGDLPQTSEECDRLLRDVATQASRRASHVFIHLVSLFNEFAVHVEQTCPAVDVPEFLRQAGLRAASGE